MSLLRTPRPRLRHHLVAILLGMAACTRAATGPVIPPETELSIVPAPGRIERGAGSFAVDAKTRFVIDPSDTATARIAEFIAAPLRLATGLPLPVSGSMPGPGAIRLHVRNAAGDAGAYDWSQRVPEEYRLTVDPDSVVLEATTHAGLFRGIQTLRQLLPAAFERSFREVRGADWPDAKPQPRPRVAWVIPSVRIEDAPRFAWRGMHLDVGRHFFPIEFIREYIDLIAAYRMNVFHWHLTEDQGWRIEIRKYPRLTSVGAFRRETILERNFDPYIGDGIPHGGFYTQAEIREIVQYAAARYITIVPEIEMPGHSVAALAAYPELACTTGPFEVFTRWGVTSDIFCPSERTFQFLDDVLDEVSQLFPGRYIHIGGDEAPKTAWQQSPLAQDIIRREGLADEDELQSWFLRRIERSLAARDRRLIGWDEILEGGLAPDATVMSWRGMDGGIAAAREGHDVIMTPTSSAYFDYYQGEPRYEPLAIGGFLPLEQVYAFEPVPSSLEGDRGRHVLGAQGNVWTEYMSTTDHVEYMLMPRMLALAEVAWTPRDVRDWPRFVGRLPAQLRRLEQLGVNYRVPDPVGLENDRLTLDDTVRIRLDTPVTDATLRYTTDGTEPTSRSAVYRGPFVLPVDENGIVVSARLFLDGGRMSAVRRARFARASLRDAVEIPAVVPGLSVDYFEGAFASADSVRSATPLRSGTATDVGLSGGERPERFGLRFRGFVRVPSDGIWTFALSSDDGSRLYVDGMRVIDHDGPHGSTTRTGEIALRAGLHAIEITYFQAGGGKSLSLAMAPQGQTPVAVPAGRLARQRDP